MGHGPEALQQFPVAHTCFNRLDLPAYDDPEVLRTRLEFCMDNIEGLGFGIA
jgi:E3 ubiquitin-protein ligase NEDD4